MKFTFAPADQPLDGFTIRRAIHRGGFGEVYQATSDGGREVALKLLQNDLEVELRGVRQCLNLSHPNLVTLFDVRTDADGDHWIVMEYVPAPTLSQVLAEQPGRGVEVDQAVAWVRGIADGVGHLHASGLVHRDIKPANVFGGPGETVRVGDVGLSKFITPGRRSAQTQSVGTVYYMAPEVARGQYGPEVDQYSLAVVAYELLTGRVPFEGESTGEILMKQLSEQPDLSAIPDSVRGVLARGLAKDPADRFASIGEFAAAFEAALTGRLVAAGAPAAATPNASPQDATAPTDDWYESLSKPRQGLIVFSGLATVAMLALGSVYRPIFPLFAFIGGPALALMWQAEFDWLASLADWTAPGRRGRFIGATSAVAALLAFGAARSGGQFAVLATIALLGLAAVWLCLAAMKLIFEVFRDELYPPSDPHQFQAPDPATTAAASPKTAVVSTPTTAKRSIPPKRQPKRGRVRPSWSRTAGAASLVPLIAVPVLTLVWLVDTQLAWPKLLFTPRATIDQAANGIVLVASVLATTWTLLASRHFGSGGLTTRLKLIAAGIPLAAINAGTASALMQNGSDRIGDLFAGILLFFVLLFGLRNWSRQVHPLRPGRVRFGSVLLSSLVGAVAGGLVGIPAGQAMLWTAIVSASVQAVAPYHVAGVTPPRRQPSIPMPQQELV